MIDAQGNNSALYGDTGPGTTWANGMNFGMNHSPGAGLITQPIDLQISMLPLSTATPATSHMKSKWSRNLEYHQRMYTTKIVTQ